jgi:predicted MFS family arabinose efflux permease
MMGLALGWSTAGVGGGYLIDSLGYASLFLAGMLSALLAVIVLVAYARIRRHRAPLPIVEAPAPEAL